MLWWLTSVCWRGDCLTGWDVWGWPAERSCPVWCEGFSSRSESEIWREGTVEPVTRKLSLLLLNLDNLSHSQCSQSPATCWRCSGWARGSPCSPPGGGGWGRWGRVTGGGDQSVRPTSQLIVILKHHTQLFNCFEVKNCYFEILNLSSFVIYFITRRSS